MELTLSDIILNPPCWPPCRDVPVVAPVGKLIFRSHFARGVPAILPGRYVWTTVAAHLFSILTGGHPLTQYPERSTSVFGPNFGGRIAYMAFMPLDPAIQPKSRKTFIDTASLLATDLHRERRSQGITLQQLSTSTVVAVANLHSLETTGQGRVATLRAVADALTVRVVGLPGRAHANDLPTRLTLAREQARLSVPGLAAKAGVSRDAITRLESGGGNLSTLYTALSVLGRTVRLRNESAKVWAPAIGDRDSRFTPQSMLDALVSTFGRISLDPCWAPGCLVQADRTFTREEDGLAKDWCGGFVFVNPPYSNSQAWAAQCRKEYEAGRAKVVLGLFKATTYGQTFQQIALTADTLFLPRRISFLGPDGQRMGAGAAPFGLALYLWGATPEQVQALVGAFGGRHLPAARTDRCSPESIEAEA